jgi:uncharacterized protein (DUF58 family)
MAVGEPIKSIQSRLENVIQTFSLTGFILMLSGMGLVIFEFQSEFLYRRLGFAGHALSILCGTALSVWGLKENVATFWPRMTGRGYQFRIPREGASFIAIMIILFIGSNLAPSNILMMVFCVMASAFVVNGWLTFTMLRDAHLHRELPDRVMAGETFSVPVTFENRSRRLSAWLMTVRDSVLHAGTILRPEILFVRVPPRSHRMGAYQFCPLRRGLYEFTHLNAFSRFPLGLVERGVGREVPHKLYVYPRLGHLKPGWQRQLMHSIEMVSNARPNKGSFNDEMHRIREFQPGDDRRMVHWRTTARMNELMVCEYHECRDRDLLVIVDGWLPHRANETQAEQFEKGLRFAATICMSYLRSSRLSTLSVILIGKETFYWNGKTGTQHADSLLDAFALLEPVHRKETDHISDIIRAQMTGQHRTLLITSRPQELKDELLQQIPAAMADLQIQDCSDKELDLIFIDADRDGTLRRDL